MAKTFSIQDMYVCVFMYVCMYVCMYASSVMCQFNINFLIKLILIMFFDNGIISFSKSPPFKRK